jgi:hypothetical protein
MSRETPLEQRITDLLSQLMLSVKRPTFSFRVDEIRAIAAELVTCWARYRQGRAEGHARPLGLSTTRHLVAFPYTRYERAPCLPWHPGRTWSMAAATMPRVPSSICGPVHGPTSGAYRVPLTAPSRAPSTLLGATLLASGKLRQMRVLQWRTSYESWDN